MFRFKKIHRILYLLFLFAPLFSSDSHDVSSTLSFSFFSLSSMCDDTCSSSGGVSTESATMASGRKSWERERRPVFHTWLCYVETKRHRDGRTDMDRGSPHRVDGGGDATVSRLSKRLPSMLLTHSASKHTYRTIILLTIIRAFMSPRSSSFEHAVPIFHMIRQNIRRIMYMCDSVYPGERISNVIVEC